LSKKKDNYELCNQTNNGFPYPTSNFDVNQFTEQKVTALALRQQTTALAVIRQQPSTALDLYKKPKTEITYFYPKSTLSETNLFVLKPHYEPKNPSAKKLVNQYRKEPSTYELSHYNACIFINGKIFSIGYFSHRTKKEMITKLIRTTTTERDNLQKSYKILEEDVENLRKICKNKIGDFVLDKKNKALLASQEKNLSVKKEKYIDKEKEIEQLKKKSFTYALISDTDLDGQKEKQYLYLYPCPRVPLDFRIDNYGVIDLEKSLLINQGEYYSNILQFLATYDFEKGVEIRLPLDVYADKSTGLPSPATAASIAEHIAKKSVIVRYNTTQYLRTHENTYQQMVFKASTKERILLFGADQKVQNGDAVISPTVVRSVEKPKFNLPRGRKSFTNNNSD